MSASGGGERVAVTAVITLTVLAAILLLWDTARLPTRSRQRTVVEISSEGQADLSASPIASLSERGESSVSNSVTSSSKKKVSKSSRHCDASATSSLRGTSMRLYSRSAECTVVPSMGSWRALCPCGKKASLGVLLAVDPPYTPLYATCEFGCATSSSSAEAPPLTVSSLSFALAPIVPSNADGLDDPSTSRSPPRNWSAEIDTRSCNEEPSKKERAYLSELGRQADKFSLVSLDVRACTNAKWVDNASLCFASVGDWGGATPNWNEVSTALTDYVVSHPEVRFLLSTGDNFYPAGVKSVNDPLWQNALEKPLAHPALQALRMYVIAGNHDQWGLPPQLEYAKTHPRWFFPDRYYVAEIPLPKYLGIRMGSDAGGGEGGGGGEYNPMVVLFCLDTYGRDFDSRQVGQLDRDLQRYATRRNVFRIVVGHVPIFSGSNHGQQPMTATVRSKLLPMFVKHKVHAYINGDDHVLETHRDSGVDFFVSGGGGGATGPYGSKRLPSTVFFREHGVFGFMVHCIQFAAAADSAATRADDGTSGGGGDSGTKLVMRTSVIEGKSGSTVHTIDTAFPQ